MFSFCYADEKKPADQEGEKSKKKRKYYVWWAEGQAGIVESWEECHSLIANKKHSNCRKFNNLEQARESLESKQKGIEILQEIKIESELKTNKEEQIKGDEHRIKGDEHRIKGDEHRIKGDEHRNKRQTEIIDSVNSVCANIKETENDLAENGGSGTFHDYKING